MLPDPKLVPALSAPRESEKWKDLQQTISQVTTVFNARKKQGYAMGHNSVRNKVIDYARI
jgi:hypothetical protein